ncbi:ATP11-domain-containing protein [Neoconidiobolus thromboides FSU 785]|nr:ATP11-domain-containing protein [Neoconidiobolus thromboides FSU 785]
MFFQRLTTRLAKLEPSLISLNRVRQYATVLNESSNLNRLNKINSGTKQLFSTSQTNRLDEDVLKRYQEKLQKKARSKGVSTVDDLLNEHFEAEKKKESITKESQIKEVNDIKREKKIEREKKTTNDATQASLDKIMDLEKLKDLDAESISKLWNAYHLKKECISAVMPINTYNKFLNLFKEYPCFLLPLPRESGGHEFYFMQTHYHQIYFTSLIEYKTHGSQARPHLIITHYPELSKEKEIVLMKGELGNNDNEKVPLSLEDSKLLILLVQQFYLVGDEKKFELVKKFNKQPEEFDHNQLVLEAGKL